MKKIVKIAAYILATLVGCIAVLMAAVYGMSSSRMARKFIVPDTGVPVYKEAADITEGKRLFLSRGCADCHGDNLAGKTFLDDPAIGRFTGTNLTSGKGGVLATRSDFDLERAIRHGVGTNGRALVFMPAMDFHSMSNQDVGRIIAYIRSVPKADSAAVEMKAGPVGRLLYLLGKIPVFISAEKIDHQAVPVSEIRPGLTLAYGKYIAQTCTGCHNPRLTGGPIQGAPPEWPPAADITPKAIGKWSELDFIRALKTGKRPDGSDMNPIMPWRNLSQMTDTEIKALWMYLKTL